MRKTLVALVALALVLGAVGYWLAARGALAEKVRTRIIIEATRALGRQVAVTRVAGDPVRGIVLEGVRIAGPPGVAGASFLQAPKIVARYHPLALFRDLLTGRGATASLIALEVDRPVLVLAMDSKGQWNYPDLPTQGQAGSPALPVFTGRIEVREGSVIYSDAASIPQVSFSAHFSRVTGTLDFAEEPFVRVTLDAINTDGQTPATLRVTGKAVPGEGTVDLDLTTQGAAVAHWSPYIVRLPWLVWQRGTLDGTLHLLASKSGADVVLDYRGHLRLRDGRALLLPRKTVLAEVDGPLTVDNFALATEGLTMMVDSSPVWVRGEIRYASEVVLDLAVRSSSLDLATLQTLLFPQARVRLTGQVRGDARIIGPLDAPQVEGTILDGAGSVNRQPFANLSSDFQFYGSQLVFDNLAASTGGGRVQGHLRLDVERGNFFALADTTDVNARVLPSVGITIDPTLQGSISGFVAAAGEPGAVIAQGRLRMGHGRIQGMAVDTLETSFWYDRGGIELDRFQASGGPSYLHADGDVTRTGRLALNLVATDLSLQSLGNQFGLRDRVSGSADFVGAVSGSVRSPVLAGEVEVRRGTLGPLPFTVARGDVRVTPTSLRTSHTTLQDGSARYQAAGEVRWDAARRLDLTVRAEDVPVQRLLEIAGGPVQLAGMVRGTVRVFGGLNNPEAAGSVELRNGSVEGQQVDRVQADFRWTGAGLFLDHAVAEANGSNVQAHGIVGRTGSLAISFVAQAVDLKDVTVVQSDLLQATGTVDLAGTITGSVASPTIRTGFTSNSLVLNGQPFDHASGGVGYQGGRLTLTPLVLQQGAGSFQLSGSVDFGHDPRVDLRANVQHGELGTVLGLAGVTLPFALSGAIDGTFAAFGHLSNPAATLNFSLTNGRLGDHTVGEAVVRADLANHAITLKTLTIKPERGELVGAGRINLRGESDVEFSGRDLDLDLLRPLLGIKRPLTGDLDFTVQATGPVANPLVGISTTVRGGGLGEASFDRLVAQAFYRDGLLHLEQGLLQQGQHKVKAEGTVPFNPTRLRFDETQPMNLRLFLADADLSLLGLLTDRIERAEGPLEGEVLITGSVARPRMAGSLKAADGLIKLRDLDPPFTAVHVQLTFDEEQVHLGELTAHLGQGTVSASGTVGIREFPPDELDLRLVVNGARLSYPPIFSGVVDANLRVERKAAKATPRVTGIVTLSSGDLFVPGITEASSTPREDVGRGAPALDVDLRAGEDLWVNVGRLRVQVHGTVHAAGTTRRPTLLGVAEASTGTFTAFNTTFTLMEAQATFAEFRGTTPYLDARAETRIGTTTVFLEIHGPPDHLDDPLLSSDPPLPRRQIVALLAGQAGLAQLRGDQEGALRLELGQVLSAPVAEAVARSLGFQEFSLQYESTQPVQLRVGRQLVSSFYLTLTSEFDILPRHIWSLEYRFTPATMLSFSVDNLGAYDLQYRIAHRF